MPVVFQLRSRSITIIETFLMDTARDYYHAKAGIDIRHPFTWKVNTNFVLINFSK